MTAMQDMIREERQPETEAAQHIVRYRDIRKSFGDFEVLKGLDLDIRQGEKITIIGPSGSGKTTIIRMLMTLEEPTSGTI